VPKKSSDIGMFLSLTYGSQSQTFLKAVQKRRSLH